MGRLGNQMFQYASLKGITSNRGFEYCIPPPSSFGANDVNVKNSNKNIYNVFNINTIQNITEFKTVNEEGHHFNEDLFNNCEDNVNLYGYFQSEKYFVHIKDLLKKDFAFKKDIVDECRKNKSEEPFISIHVRRGDYISLQSFHPVLPLEYYKTALTLLPDIRVLVFSDDTDWVKEQVLFQSDRFTICNYKDAEKELCLMSLCDYHIICNSSFSWWGAWLSNSKKVIAPFYWFGPSLSRLNINDLYPETWNKINF